MKKVIFLALFSISISAIAQSKYLTKTGQLNFEASVPSFEEVAAKNNAVTAILNTENGEFAALALVKGFRFKNALMEEHFNENYAESDDYTPSPLKGKIDSLDFDAFRNKGSNTSIDGSLTFHGVTKQVEGIPLTLKKEDEKIIISGNFKVLASDFEIEIPKIVANKLSNEVNIDFRFELVKK